MLAAKFWELKSPHFRIAGVEKHCSGQQLPWDATEKNYKNGWWLLTDGTPPILNHLPQQFQKKTEQPVSYRREFCSFLWATGHRLCRHPMVLATEICFQEGPKLSVMLLTFARDNGQVVSKPAEPSNRTTTDTPQSLSKHRPLTKLGEKWS